MNKRMLFCTLVISTVLTGLVMAQKKNSISGRVMDNADKPIPDVRVQVYRNSRVIGKPDPMLTDSEGKYSIDFDEGEPVETVRYDQADYTPATVEGLSGRRDHTIHKTLNKATKLTSYVQIHDVLCAFETIYELDSRNDMVKQNFERYKYRAALEEIDKAIESLVASPALKNELKQRVLLIKQK